MGRLKLEEREVERLKLTVVRELAAMGSTREEPLNVKLKHA